MSRGARRAKYALRSLRAQRPRTDYEPPAFLGVVDLRATPFDGFDAFLPVSAVSSFFPPPRRRSAAALSRPPTPFGFGASAFFASASAAARGLNSLPINSIWATSAASPLRKPRRNSLV